MCVCIILLLFVQQRYQTQPLEFVRIIQNCLLREQELVEQQETTIVSICLATQGYILSYLGPRNTQPTPGDQPGSGMDYLLYRKTGE